MPLHPDDRPDPAEQPLRARVPEHVAAGCFSTGVIVMTAQTEFIMDFVQNLGRPFQIVARVVMPHSVLPQLVDALGRNMQLYRSRWGELPQPTLANQAPAAQAPSPGPATVPGVDPNISIKPGNVPQDSSAALNNSPQTGSAQPIDPASAVQSSNIVSAGIPISQPTANNSAGPSHQGGQDQPARQPSAQEIYDDLKIRDELLSGSYANAVMIGHGPHEFSFDFITNFYPNSAVSVRVFLAAGQIPRLYESLRGTWDQLRMRMPPPPFDQGGLAG